MRRVARWQWPARFPLVQFPNAPLMLALAAAVSASLTHGSAHRAARSVYFMAIAAWAYEEVRNGENWFRRALGAGVGAYTAVELAKALSG